MTDPEAARLAAEHFGWLRSSWVTLHGLVNGWVNEDGAECFAINSDGELHIYAEAAEAMALELKRNGWRDTASAKNWHWDAPDNRTWAIAPDWRLSTLRAFAAMKGAK